MSDPTEIYLQPECCADEYVGRLWCEHDAPVDCEDGVPWTKYVRADIAEADLAAARATNLKLRQYAKHYPECPMWGATGDEVCNCGLSGAMMETDKSSDPGVSDPNSVICPNCCSQFQATPVNVQEELARLRGELEQARLLFNKEFNENNESRRRLKADLAAARDEIEILRHGWDERAAVLRQDLAAARADAALLRSTLIDTAAVMGMSSLPSDSEWEKIRNKALQLVAALAGEKK